MGNFWRQKFQSIDFRKKSQFAKFLSTVQIDRSIDIGSMYLNQIFLPIRKNAFLIKIFQRKLEIRPLFIIWGWAFTTVTGSHWLRWTGHPYKLVWISLLESRILFLVYKHGLDGLIWMEIYDRKHFIPLRYPKSIQ